MAATVTVNHRLRGRATGTINLGSSYATNGIAVTPELFGYGTLTSLDVKEAGGYTFKWDETAAKVKAYTAFKTFTATYDPASLSTVAARDDAITVTGVAATDIVIGFQAAAALTAGLVAQEVRVSGTDTITVRLMNPTAGSVDGASGTWTFYVARAGGAAYEVVNAADLSAVTAEFEANGY